MAELARQHDDLASVMSLVRHEIREHVRYIERQVAPDVSLGRRDTASRCQAECEERLDPVTASAERGEQLASRRGTAVDGVGDGNAVLPAERPEAVGPVLGPLLVTLLALRGPTRNRL